MGVEARAAAPVPLRILVVTTGLRLGGAEQQIASLAHEFVARGHDVAVLSLTSGCEIRMPANVQLTELRMRKNPFSFAASLLRARDLVRRWKPDIIHAHMIHANLFARMLRRLGIHTPLICSAHSAREGGRMRALAYRLTDRWCDLTTHVSRAGATAMVAANAAPTDRITIMPNGIDTDRFRPDAAEREQLRRALGLKPADIAVVNVGRLVPEKNQALLIDAFADAHARHPETRLLIAGDGPLRNALAARVESLALGPVVTLLGARNDVPELLRAADVFVLSSSVEGMPLVVAEAMASGLPVVATEAAGVREIADGLALFSPIDDRARLAENLHNAVFNLAALCRDGTARRARIRERFDLSAVAGQWLDHYQRLIHYD